MLAVAIGLVFAAQKLPQVDGLAAGERAPLAGFAPGSERDFGFGRVVDATTGRPIEGATIETWTEGWDDDAVRVCNVRSARDGSFEVLRRTDTLEAEKVLVRASGMRSTVLAFSDLSEPVALLPAPAPLAFRVVDLEGRPIEGAELRTHQTCAHAPAACFATSDASGLLRAADAPALAHNADLQLGAPGFESIYGLDEASLLGGGAPAVVRLARRRPLAIRVLDEHGAPAANARVVVNAAPDWLVRRADANGRVEFDTLFAQRNFLHVREHGIDLALVDGPGFDGFEPSLRLGGDRREPREDDATVDVRVADAELPLLVVHELGWFTSRAGRHAFPPGKLSVRAGGRFSGFASEAREFELAALGEARVELAAAREPCIVLGDDATDDWEVVVEAAADSVRVRAKPGLRIPVPAGESLAVLALGPSRVRRADLDGILHDTPLSLRALPEIDVRADPADPRAATATLAFRIPPELAEGARISLHGAWGVLDADELRASGLAAKLLPNAPFEAWLSAPDRELRCVTGTTPRARASATIEFRLSAMARIEIEGPVRRIVDGETVLPGGDEELTSSIAWPATAGPHLVHVEMLDGLSLDLDLVLRAGETRRLRIH